MLYVGELCQPHPRLIDKVVVHHKEEIEYLAVPVKLFDSILQSFKKDYFLKDAAVRKEVWLVRGDNYSCHRIVQNFNAAPYLVCERAGLRMEFFDKRLEHQVVAQDKVARQDLLRYYMIHCVSKLFRYSARPLIAFAFIYGLLCCDQNIFISSTFSSTTSEIS